MKRKILVTGSSGLIGSEVCLYFGEMGYEVHGIDNNERAVLFGPEGDTVWMLNWLKKKLKNFHHYKVDIRNRSGIRGIVKKICPDAIVHSAAQPSHDKAAEIPFKDFEINALGTLNLLEALKSISRDVPFVFLSTNKVYGDSPNSIRMKESETRWDYDDPKHKNGINENFSVDQTMHSLFGVSKLSADILVQEYGKYFSMPTTILRCGCLTGPNHSGVELHGFLSYLVKCNIEEKRYTIFGYKGKQVRDNLHSYDVACFIDKVINFPNHGEVFNLGGGKENSCSILEAFKIAESMTGIKMNYVYSKKNRIGDHICYYSDLTKVKKFYPDWKITKNLSYIFDEIINRKLCEWKHS